MVQEITRRVSRPARAITLPGLGLFLPLFISVFLSHQKHGIAVAVEAVPKLNGPAVGPHYRLQPGKGRHQGYERTPGKVEVRQQGVHVSEPVGWPFFFWPKLSDWGELSM